jgi:hypothetical protein
MSRLSYGQRERLPDSAFAVINRGARTEKTRRKYPVPTAEQLRKVGVSDAVRSAITHARNALARASQHGSARERREVCSLVRRRQPEVHETKCAMHRMEV